jgi:hypothetical protein
MPIPIDGVVGVLVAGATLVPIVVRVVVGAAMVVAGFT